MPGYVARALPLLLVVMLMAPLGVSAQLLSQPTPPPTVTAENESWFVDRAPLLFGGTVYFPAGPQVHFNQNEMVRAGFYGAIPVYTRTTLEPRSIIFVPLSGGVMQPYERRRSGELAGTEGSVPPSFPVASAAEQAGSPRSIRAPGPPTGPASLLGAGTVVGSNREDPRRPAAPGGVVVGTTGSVPGSRPGALASGTRPRGINAVFIEYGDQRWFSAGQAVPFDAATFRSIGTYDGLAVYADPARPATIFVPVSREAAALVVPYSNARGR